MQALQAYEAQVSSLVRGMSRLEEELHKAQEEKANLLSDLASVRELCVKLDSGKELAARQLTSKSMDLERVKPAAVVLKFFKQTVSYLSCEPACVPLSVHIAAPAAVIYLGIFVLPVNISACCLGHRRTGRRSVRGRATKETTGQ